MFVVNIIIASLLYIPGEAIQWLEVAWVEGNRQHPTPTKYFIFLPVKNRCTVLGPPTCNAAAMLNASPDSECMRQ